MKRYMRQTKINFFESPHPQHFDVFARQHLIYPTLNLADFHEDDLFNTPLKPQTPTQHPYFQIQYQPVSTQQPQERQKIEGLLQSQEHLIEEEHGSMTPGEINQKIDFSREESQDLLIPLTPQKNPVWNQDSLDKNTTNQKKNHVNASPSMSDPRLCERGLKKLAFEAFMFVSTQKKTTYKEVARKLIGQINDDNEIETEKKGQMNIKRRVYDALNVLIALGLLKRHGNKILGKITEQKLNIGSSEVDKIARLQTRQEELSEERDYLRRMLKQKQEAVAEKRRMVEAMKKKIASIQALQARNKALLIHKDKIPMPFVVLCSKQASLSPRGQTEESLSLEKDINQLTARFPSDKIQLFGDIDAIMQGKSHLLSEKVDRSRKSRRM